MKELNIDKIYDNKRFLQTITIELTNMCNWRCKHCYLDDSNIELMSLDKIYEIIDEAREIGVYNLRLSGGEISTYPQLSKIITYARKRYMNVSLLSNMSVLDDEVLSSIEKYGLDSVEATVFSTDEEIHDKFVGTPGALNKTLTNLKKIKQQGTDILVKTWAVKSNINELEKMRDYYLSLGYYFSVGVQIYSDVNGKMKLPKEEQLSEQEYCYALKLEDSSRILPIKWKQTSRLCEDFSTCLYITYEGEVIPCAKYRKPYANIYKDSIKDIWAKSSELHCLQNYCWNDVTECNECGIKEYCKRCGAMSYIKGGDFLHNCKETCLLAKIRASNYKIVPEGGLY